jgi:hypothetical protein
VFGYGIRVFPHVPGLADAGSLLYEGPRPRVETGDYFADRLTEAGETIAINRVAGKAA